MANLYENSTVESSNELDIRTLIENSVYNHINQIISQGYYQICFDLSIELGTWSTFTNDAYETLILHH